MDKLELDTGKSNSSRGLGRVSRQPKIMRLRWEAVTASTSSLLAMAVSTRVLESSLCTASKRALSFSCALALKRRLQPGLHLLRKNASKIKFNLKSLKDFLLR
jgi:hypothetical protein